MRQVRVYRLRDKAVFADPCLVARSFWDRFTGLMGKSRLEAGTGLLLEPCNSVHTFFMKFAIDVIYLDGQYKVLSVRRGMKPWRMDFPVFGARAVLELPVGHASNLAEGDLLCLS